MMTLLHGPNLGLLDELPNMRLAKYLLSGNKDDFHMTSGPRPRPASFMQGQDSVGSSAAA